METEPFFELEVGFTTGIPPAKIIEVIFLFVPKQNKCSFKCFTFAAKMVENPEDDNLIENICFPLLIIMPINMYVVS